MGVAVCIRWIDGSRCQLTVGPAARRISLKVRQPKPEPSHLLKRAQESTSRGRLVTDNAQGQHNQVIFSGFHCAEV
jgi:hypothetical protein